MSPPENIYHNSYPSASGFQWNESRDDFVTALTKFGESSRFDEPSLPSSMVPMSQHGSLTPPYELVSTRDYNEVKETWRTKDVTSWTNSDVMSWMNNEANENGILCTEYAFEKFASLDGLILSKLTLNEFENYDIKYGRALFESLQKIKNAKITYPHQLNLCESIESIEQFHPTSMKYLSFSNLDKESSLPALDNINQGQIQSYDKHLEKPVEEKKKKKLRPSLTKKKKKEGERIGRLWEFLRDLLKNEQYCPSIIVWDNYDEGMFRFVHSGKVARLWGNLKGNPDMNYEKLSRAMRYYYRSEVLRPVERRLVYQFGPTATGWRVDNPILTPILTHIRG